MTYPFFVSVKFEPTDAPKTPLTPVEGVDLAYNKGGSLEWTRFTVKGGCSYHQMWDGVAEYVNEFTRQLPDYAIVGWNLRNLEWPAIVFNTTVENTRLDRKLLLPPTQKWNNLSLVDLRNLVLQGGFSEEEFTLEEVYRSMAAKMETENPEPIAMVKFVYDKYAGLP